jgi:hypothetical protein
MGIEHPRTVYLGEAKLDGARRVLCPVVRAGEPRRHRRRMLGAHDPTVDARAERRGGSWPTATPSLKRHRAALEAGADPAIVTEWIAEVLAERDVAQRALDAAMPVEELDPDELRRCWPSSATCARCSPTPSP